MAFSDNSPTDEWDDWGATENVTPQSDFGGQEESWDDWNDQSSSSNDDWSNNTDSQQSQDDWGSQPSSGDDEWDDWGNPPQNDDSQQAQDDWGSQASSGGSQQAQDDWSDWGNQTPNGDSRQTQDDWSDWENQQSQNSQPSQNANEGWSDWDDQSNQSGNFIDQSAPQEEWGDWNNNITNPVHETAPVRFNFSSKKIAFVIAGIFLGLAIIFMGMDKIHIGKKPSSQNNQQQQQQVQQTQQQQQQAQQPQVQVQTQQPVQQQAQQSQVQTQPVASGVTLVEIPDSTVLNYSGDVFEANGVVSAKRKYVQGHQVLYCITINLTFGASSENINYYCNYASYNAVTVGDIVVVTYQQVDDNYISVSAISK